MSPRDFQGLCPGAFRLVDPDGMVWAIANLDHMPGIRLAALVGPEHCSFCSVWRTDGQRPRQRGSEAVIKEIIELRRLGFRFVALADNNFYPVTLRDLQLASQQEDTQRLEELKGIRAERFELMARLPQLPPDMVFFTQITMEAAEDPAFLDVMQQANIKGALVGVESVTPEGLKDIHKEFTVQR